MLHEGQYFPEAVWRKVSCHIPTLSPRDPTVCILYRVEKPEVQWAHTGLCLLPLAMSLHCTRSNWSTKTPAGYSVGFPLYHHASLLPKHLSSSDLCQPGRFSTAVSRRALLCPFLSQSNHRTMMKQVPSAETDPMHLTSRISYLIWNSFTVW